MRFLIPALLGLLLATAPRGTAAQELSCPGFVARAPSLIHPAGLSRVAAGRGEVDLTFIGHSTFLIQSAGGVRAATDYNDYVRAPVTPDIATMNRAHSTHYSLRPEPGIKHLLPGWGEAGAAARHDVQLGDVRVRNVTTNIRSYGGDTTFDGNSIFVFETADLCIAHLGHLHHVLEAGHLKQLGKIDVLLVPVDGGYTLDLEGMMEVLTRIGAPLMLPMHYFGQATLARFLDRARAQFDVATSDTSSITVSRATLPARPKVLVLPGR